LLLRPTEPLLPAEPLLYAKLLLPSEPLLLPVNTHPARV